MSPAPGAVRVRLTISGRVQGVYFRESCRNQAHLHGVKGWVRNRRDGTVEVVAEGPRASVDGFVTWCHTGPSRAQVTWVAISDEQPGGESSFRIRPTA